jgi:hypothetical protein
MPKESILEEAQRIVHGDRGENYGHPFEDFSRTAKIWSAILGITVEPEQVALCMVGVKISREVNRPKRDNIVDGAGYFETLDMVKEARESMNAPGLTLTDGEAIIVSPEFHEMNRALYGVNSLDDWENID